MTNLLRSIKWLLPISGIFISILGITMLFTPFENLVRLAIFIGIAMFISGIFEIASYFGRERDERYVLMLASGSISVLFGLWTMFGSGMMAVTVMLPFVFATWIIFSGITRVIGLFSQKSKSSILWICMLVIGILGTGLGFLLLFHPMLSAKLISYLLGIMFIAHGINSVVLFFRIRKFIERMTNDCEYNYVD